MAVLVLGGIVIDYISKAATIDKNANLVDDFCQSLGGMGYNTAAACAQLGVDTEIIATVGDDFPEVETPKGLTLNLQVDKKLGSTRCFLFYGDKGERQYFYRGAYNHLDPNACAPSVKRADIVHFAGVVPAYLDVMAQAKKAGKTISFNPGYDIHHYNPGGKLMQGMINGADYLIVNEDELEQLGTPPAEIAKKKTVIVTKGTRGSEVFMEGGKNDIGVYLVKTRSPYGAGDTFIGAFLASISKGKGPLDATKIGSAAASFAVEQSSTAPELNWEKVLQRAKKI